MSSVTSDFLMKIQGVGASWCSEADDDFHQRYGRTWYELTDHGVNHFALQSCTTNEHIWKGKLIP